MSLAGKVYYATCRTRLGHTAALAAVRAMRGSGLLSGFHMPLDALSLDHAAVAGLMNLWSRTHWSSGDGMMPPDQLLAVYRLAVTWPAEGDIVELGSWVGLTTGYLAAACRVRERGRVWAVDTFAGTKEGGESYPSIQRYDGSTLPALCAHLSRAGVADFVTPLVGLTTDLAEAYPGKPIRVLLIDADHSYEGVRADYECWARHVAPGGLIVFHDYLMPPVARFVDEMLDRDGRVAAAPGRVVPNIMAVTWKGKVGGTGRCTRGPVVTPPFATNRT